MTDSKTIERIAKTSKIKYDSSTIDKTTDIINEILEITDIITEYTPINYEREESITNFSDLREDISISCENNEETVFSVPKIV